MAKTIVDGGGSDVSMNETQINSVVALLVGAESLREAASSVTDPALKKSMLASAGDADAAFRAGQVALKASAVSDATPSAQALAAAASGTGTGLIDLTDLNKSTADMDAAFAELNKSVAAATAASAAASAASVAAAKAAADAAAAAASGKGGVTPVTTPAGLPGTGTVSVVNTYTDGNGDVWAIMSDGTSKKTGVNTGAVKKTQDDAIALLKKKFESYGLGSLAGKIEEFVKKGYSSDTVSLLLQDTAEYQARFAGNAARGKAGLPVLSPAEYLSAEASYRSAMQAAGLPAGFYDDNTDFAKFIGNDVSPAEFNARLNAARESISNTDKQYTDSLQRLYGLSTGDMIAYALDPAKALPLVQRKAAAVDYAAAAAQQGINTISAQTAEYYGGDIGVSQAQAQQGFASIAQMQDPYAKLTNIYGITPTGGTLGDLQSATFGGVGSAAAQERIRKAASSEKAAFSGSSGIGQTSLLTGDVAGTL